MNLSAVKAELVRLRQSMPAIVSSEESVARHANALERIEREPEGLRRNLVISLWCSHLRRVDEPAEFAEFLAAVGDERLRAVFPDGNFPTSEPDPGVRARARAWKAPPGYECKITSMLRAQIAREKAAQL